MTVAEKLEWIKRLSIFSAIAGLAILMAPLFLGTDKIAFGNASELASAVATTAVLLVGILAVTVVVSVESAEFKATEQVKTDLLSLAATLSSIMRKVCAAEKIDKTRPDLEVESNEFSRFSAGITALALQSWASKSPKGKDGKELNFLQFFVCLGKGTLVLRSPEQHNLNTRVCADLFAPMYLLLSDLSEKNVLEISKQIADIDSAISSSLKGIKDPFIQHVLDLFDQSNTRHDDSADRLRALHAHGVMDPDLDLWIAVLDGNADALRVAVESGGNTEITMDTLLQRHANVTVAA